MSKKDLFHEAVKIALQKDGWTISDDPLLLEYAQTRVRVDLGAERLILANRDKEQIAIEIKSFLGASAINDFHLALGQYLNYDYLLELSGSTRLLYLAIPRDTFDDFFTTPFAQKTIDRYQIRLIVYDPIRQEIIKWKK